ncbi:hypothetical protein P7K49_037949 [Saguinus oedipus]|uniref:O-methyltransferase C-terminal domain-containing protein n=1 Tax=Saguinus oedipus TaxID=9490 RepID=A0ABQ9TD87_SAGOE|nr:hypothetical protein P7K49_037949 [Saguinus oedipus]
MAPAVFQDVLYQSPEMRLWFMQAMHCLSKLNARYVATAFDLSGFSSACDVGVVSVLSIPGRPGRTARVCFPAGCTGALAQELVRENPHLQVTVFDLPETIELAAHFQPTGPQAAQIRFAAGEASSRLPCCLTAFQRARGAAGDGERLTSVTTGVHGTEATEGDHTRAATGWPQVRLRELPGGGRRCPHGLRGDTSRAVTRRHPMTARPAS